MRDEMVHRGPDGQGLWLSADRRAGLGFRRLAIVDLSPAANQPMANEDGSVQVVFNGEIYNHAKLRPELLARGHRFRTHSSAAGRPSSPPLGRGSGLPPPTARRPPRPS